MQPHNDPRLAPPKYRVIVAVIVTGSAVLLYRRVMRSSIVEVSLQRALDLLPSERA